jgi:hypothetical protein
VLKIASSQPPSTISHPYLNEKFFPNEMPNQCITAPFCQKGM